MKKKRNTKTGVRGLNLHHGLYVWQPPQRDGVRPPRVHLGTRDLAEALRLVAEIRQRGAVRAAQEPLADMCGQYLVAKRKRGDHRGAATTRAAKPALRSLARHVKARASEVTPDHILRWKEAMLSGDRPLSRATCASYLRYAQSFFSWLHADRRIVRNPFDGLPKGFFPKSLPTKREQFCPRELRDQLLAESAGDPDLCAALHLGFLAGLRRGEILALRPGWVLTDPAGRPTHLQIGNDPDGGFTVKDGEAKTVPVSDRLADFLLGYGFGAERGPYVVAPQYLPGAHAYRWDWKRRWRKFMERQGCPWVTPHTMRHTFVTLMLSAPPDRRPSLLHLERWTGTSAEVLKRNYAHLIEDRGLINAAD